MRCSRSAACPGRILCSAGIRRCRIGHMGNTVDVRAAPVRFQRAAAVFTVFLAFPETHAVVTPSTASL